MSRHSTGGRDADGEMYPASFECDDCGLFLSWPVTEEVGVGILPAAEDPTAQPMLAMIREHDNGGCHGDAGAFPAALNSAAMDYPRNVYFGAEDRRLDGPQQLVEKYLPFERSRRQKQIANAITDAEQLITALKAIRSFDVKGNVHHALPQVTDALADVVAHTRNLVADVESSLARFVEFGCPPPDGGSPAESAVAVEPTPQAPAAADNSPRPGPHLVSVKVFSPDESPAAQLAAFDRAVARRGSL